MAIALVPVVLGILYLRDEMAREGRLGFPVDDAYIHFQFARNLATGHGFAFNPGEPSAGATSPLWVVLLAAGRVMGLPIEWVAVVLGLASAALAAVLAFEVGLAAGLPPALGVLAGLALGTVGRFTWASISGMEPCLATALALLVLRLALSPARTIARGAWMGAAAGLAAETRPELLLLGGLVGMAEVSRVLGGPRGRPDTHGPLVRWAPVLVYAAVLALVVLPYVGFCLATTGRPLPNTYYVKSVIAARLRPDLLAQRREVYFRDMGVWLWRDNPATALLALPGAVLWLARRRPRGSALVALWPPCYWAYAWVASPLHFNLSRYTMPLMPCVALVAMAPLEAVLAWRGTPVFRRLATAVATALTLVPALARQTQYHEVFLGNVDNILRMQVTMGEWVRDRLPAGARVATNDIGAITWYGGRYCIDLEGLVSSDLVTVMLGRLGDPSFTHPDDVLLDYLPRHAVSYCILFPEWHPALARAPWLERVHEIDYPNTTGGGNALVAYRVVGSP
ncbi:MAG: hypothetical protein ACHQ52_15130 [Candidatus Eisenbacteria bacterium]